MTTAAKRPNVAEEESVPSGDEEINLVSIHKVLIDVQSTVHNLLKEHSHLLREVSELKSLFKKQESQIENMKKQLGTAVKENVQLKEKLHALKKKVEAQDKDIEDLYDCMDALEQYSRKNSLEIEGIPEGLHVCESDEAVVLKLADALEVEIKPEDIDICHRIKRKNSKPIVARFATH